MKPHKCPVCEGKGCHACDNGVVWGPESAEESAKTPAPADPKDLTYEPQ